MPYVTTRPRNFRTESLFSQNFAEFCGKKRCIEMRLFMYGNSPEMRETEGKNLGMQISLFLCGNSVEMRETEGNSVGKKQRHGNEFIYVRNSAEMWETGGKSCTLTFVLINVSLIRNGT